MKLKKPKLDAPNLKMPPFLADVYQDLRDRRLLPLVALVAVAILAVPFLLGSESETAPPPLAEGRSTPTLQADPASLTVVEARPGLRDYKKRLRGRTPSDPFEQRYTGLPQNAELSVETSTASVAEEGSAETGGGEGSTEPGGSGSVPPEQPVADGGGSSSPGESGAGQGSSEPRLFGWRPDVRFGVAGSGDLTLRKELPLGSFLPRNNPILVFIGATQDGKRALFDVSPEVVFVRGDGNCVGGKQSCRTLSLRDDQAVTLLTESPGRTFQVAVDRIEFVELHLPKRSSTEDREHKASGLSSAVPQNFSN